MTEKLAKQSEVQAIISGNIITYLNNKGLDVNSLAVDEDLVEKGVLDSFDSIAIIAELEETFKMTLDFSDDSQEDFRMSIASLSKLVSR